MTKTVEIPPGELTLRVPHHLVGDPILCAGIRFQKIDSENVELVLLSEADVELLTEPEGRS